MAITLITSPSALQSSGTPVIFRVTTNSTDITTRIQYKVYYRRNQDEFYNISSVSVQSKVPETNYFEINVASTLDKLLECDLQSGSTALITGIENSALEYYIVFSEYYPSSLPVVHDTLTTSTFYICNTKLYHTETQSVFTGSDWYMDGVASHKFLTDAPLITKIRASERIQLGFITSYTDPVIKVRETKNNGSTATVTYEIANNTYSPKLWDWEVDANEAVSIVTTSAPQAFITGNDGVYKYMADDNNVMWGGVNLIDLNDILEITLPVISASSATLNMPIKAVTSACDFEVYYFHTGVWNASALNPLTAITASFTTLIEALPAGTTKLRIKKIESNANHLYIAWGNIEYVDDNVINKRCQFTLDTTHIDSDTYKLEVWAESTSSSNDVISEVRTFIVDTDNYYGTTVRFAVKNKRGDFDHFTYTQGYSEVLTAEKTKTTKELPNTFTTKDFGRSTLNVGSEKVFTCYSKYIEESELEWWSTIIESKQVYVIENDTPISVDILTDSVVTYTHTDLVQLKIDWTYSVKR